VAEVPAKVPAGAIRRDAAVTVGKGGRPPAMTDDGRARHHKAFGMEMSTGRQPDTAEPVTCIIANGERCGPSPGPRSPLLRPGLGLTGANALAEEHGFQRSGGPLDVVS